MMQMENVLIDQSTGGFDFRRRITGDGCRRRGQPPRSIYSSFVYAPPPPPFQYPPYDLYSSLSLPLQVQPYSAYISPPASPALRKYATLPPRPPASGNGKATVAGMASAAAVQRKVAGECKRKKPPRAPRSSAEEPPRAPRRRKPLERAAPLPSSPAVAEALDDLEREVTRGFVVDLMHALAPPPSSLPLPTFSLVRAAAAKATAAPCAV